MFLIIAAVLLFCFVANVVLGATLASAPLSDVAEALVLFGASIAFVAGVVRLEAERSERADDQDKV